MNTVPLFAVSSRLITDSSFFEQEFPYRTNLVDGEPKRHEVALHLLGELLLVTQKITQNEKLFVKEVL